MNPRTLRRLAKDHAQLHNDGLPTNFLFPPTAASSAHSDDLTQLNVLLAGPTHTPFEHGLWRLHLALPDSYPQNPPTASFRTKIFHPNVNEHGQICVETLKRDWDSKLTLRDVLVTVSCLLIQPNPDSALNAEAGALIQQDYASFAQRAELMTSIHAAIPSSLAAAVKEAQNRGNEAEADELEDSIVRPEPAARRRRTIARVRGMKRSEVSPGDAPARRVQRPPATAALASESQPFVFQGMNDDVFGTSKPPGQSTASAARSPQIEDDEDEEMAEADQENAGGLNAHKSPSVTKTPRRPHGMPVPLGELMLPEQDEGDTSVDETDTEMEAEYPPSPRKSPVKGSSRMPTSSLDRAQDSRQAPMITPPNLNSRPLADHSSIHTPITSARKADRGRRVAFKLSRRLTPEPPDSSVLENSFFKPASPQRKRSGVVHGVARARSPDASDLQLQEAQQRSMLEAKLWIAAGQDIRRYNKGDFDGTFALERKAPRW